MTPLRELFGVGALCSALLVACDASKPGPAGAGSASSARPAESRASAQPAIAPVQPPKAAEGCRALSVTGDAPLEPGALLEGANWLVLPRGARISVRHGASARELSFEGPGRAVICRDGEEQVLLAAGRITTSAGPGARPGAEVLIATPFGLVRYGDATLEVRTAGRKTEVVSRAGEAWLELAHGASLRGEPKLLPGKKASLSGPPAVTPESSAAACAAAAVTAKDSARALLDPAGTTAPDAGSLGARAAAQVRDRRAARYACAIAAAAIGQLKDPAERDRLGTELERSERVWKAMPRRAETGPK